MPKVISGFVVNNRIRIANIGVNSRGDELAKNFVKQKNAEIIYICDVDERAIAKTNYTVISAAPSLQTLKESRN